MQVIRSNNTRPVEAEERIQERIDRVDPTWLKMVVETISVPRHYLAQPEKNREIADWIEAKFETMGYQVTPQGEYRNLIATPDQSCKPKMLIGAHYDSVPGTPGADDNGSAVAAMLGCAKAVAGLGLDIAFVAFNREEDGLLGSRDFVSGFLPDDWPLQEVHVLEMVGYCDHNAGSQRMPKGLPVRLGHDRGDFLALVANRDSNALIKPIVRLAATYLPGFPVWGLKVFLGLENRFQDIRRSDHAPFWDKGIPALMWTDTSEFRNHNYHGAGDLPETLDYEFMAKVTRLLTARAMETLG